MTGPARTRADALVRERARGGGAAEIEALESACQLLEGALAEVPDYRAAQAAAESLRAAEQRVRTVKPDAQQADAVAAQRARADDAFAARRWRDAATDYRAAEHAWVELEQRIQTERTAAQLAAQAAAALATTLDGFDADGAQSIAAGELAAARTLEADAHALQQQREWTSASAAFDAAREAFARLQARVEQELSAQLTAATDELRQRLESASSLPAIVVGAAREAAEATLAAPKSAKPSVNLSTTRAALAALDNALNDAVEYGNVAAQRDAADRLFAGVDQLGLGRRQLAQLQRLANDAATAFERREWAHASAIYAQLTEQLESLKRRDTESKRLAAARNAVEETRAALDTAVAQDCAAAALREAEEAYSNASDAERQGNFDVAVTAFEAAGAAFAEVAEAVSREHARLVTDARAALQQVVDEQCLSAR